MRFIPNIITCARLLLALPITWALCNGSFEIALALFVVAGVSDGLDGWLARRYGWQSRFGAFLDPAADKMLMGLVFIVLALQGQIALWFATLIVGRDLIIAIGALSYRLLYGPFEHASTRLGKLSTVLQVLFVLAVLVRLSDLGLDAVQLRTAEHLLAIAVVVLAVCSGAEYVWTWSRRALARRGTEEGRP